MAAQMVGGAAAASWAAAQEHQARGQRRETAETALRRVARLRELRDAERAKLTGLTAEELRAKEQRLNDYFTCASPEDRARWDERAHALDDALLAEWIARGVEQPGPEATTDADLLPFEVA